MVLEWPQHMALTTQTCPSSVRVSPLRPEPHPRSSSSRVAPSCGRASSSMARCVN